MVDDMHEFQEKITKKGKKEKREKKKEKRSQGDVCSPRRLQKLIFFKQNVTKKS